MKKLNFISTHFMKQAPWQFVKKYYTDDLAERNCVESKWFLSWLREVKGDNVLSLGCGPNLFDDAQFFTKTPKNFVGIDHNRNNIKFLKYSTQLEIQRCRNILQNKNVNIILIEDNIKKIRKEFENNFDTVYAVGVLGMFKEDDIINLFKNIRTYLKPGGKILDIDWTDCRLPIDKIKKRESYEWYSKQGPSIVKLGKLLEQTGFKILKHDVYKVSDPEAYSWGKIYAFLGEKI